MNRENKIAAVGLGVIGIILVIKLALIAGIVYVAWHFISKWW